MWLFLQCEICLMCVKTGLYLKTIPTLRTGIRLLTPVRSLMCVKTGFTEKHLPTLR
ncbi:unnamed protein product, partial [Staurois parvus]